MADIFDEIDARAGKRDIFDEVAEQQRTSGPQPIDIREFRRRFPGYDHVDDDTLSRKLHAKYYSHVPFETFAAKFVGAKPPEGFAAWQKENDRLLGKQVERPATEPSGGFAAWQKENDRLLGPAPAAPQPDLSTQTGQLASRFGKQLYTRGVADTVKGLVYSLGGGRVISTLAAPFVQARINAKRRSVVTGTAGKDISLREAQQLIKAGMMDQLPVPTFEVEPPKTLAEKITDVGAGLTAMVGQLAVTKKVLPPMTPEPIIWEVQISRQWWNTRSRGCPRGDLRGDQQNPRQVAHRQSG